MKQYFRCLKFNPFWVLFLFSILLEGQDIKKIDSLINSFKNQNSKEIYREARIYTYMETFNIKKEKFSFINHFIKYSKEKEEINDLIFGLYLKGDTNFWSNNFTDASKYYHQIINFSKKENNIDGQFLGLVSLFAINKRKKNKDSTIFYKERSDKLLPNVTNKYYKAIYNRRLADYYITNEEYQKALDLLLQIDTTPGLAESVLRCRSLSNIGWIYEHLNYPEKAKIYFIKAQKIASRTKVIRQLKFYDLKLGHMELFNFGNPKGAIKKYVDLLSYYADSGNIYEGVLYSTLGFAYTQTGQMKKSFEYLEKSKNIMEKKKDSNFLCLPYTYYTHYYFKKGEFQNAINAGEKALRIIQKRKLFKARKLILLDKLSEAYIKTGEIDRAYNLLNELNTIKSELELKKNKIAFIESQFELTKSAEKLKISELNNQLLSKSKVIILTFLIGLSSIFLFLLYFFINRKKTNEKLREIDALKTNFFTNISHEFRTPLTLISAPIQESLEDSCLSNEKRKHFEIAQKNIKRLSSLVDQLLELSKIDSGNRKLLIQKNSPTKMVAAWSESFSYLAKQKNIDFKTDISNKETQAWFDYEALENIVINLLGNAIKYTPKNGQITLQVSIQNEQLNIAVKNTGQGLTDKQMKTIFNRFYQTDGQNEGAGVGLSLVQELTELHGGKIQVTSELSKWVLFEVCLCIDKSKLKNAEIKESIDFEALNSARELELNEIQEEDSIQSKELPILLVVEDNTDVRTLLTDTFKKEYEVIQAVNGEEGILKALDKIPDIIISDLMMPIKDGIALTNTLKNDERTSHIPIILLTAKAGDENELTGINVGVDDYITKPFNQKILKSKTASLVALRKKLQSRYSQEVILKPKDIAITSVDEKFLERVQKILDEKLVESTFTSSEFSKTIHMSRMQLHRKLKALTGLSTSEFLRAQRLKLAARILKKSDINVSQVGYSVGFNDHAYFSKCFKEVFSATPSEFASKK